MNDLSLQVISDSNIKTITVLDTSFYYDKDSITNLLFEVLSPSLDKWITHKVNPNFYFILNASSLGICNVETSQELPSLDDGVYEFKISYTPNFASQRIYYHLNIKNLLKYYWNEVESLYSRQCSIPNREFQYSRDLLLRLKMDMDAAKWMVEEKHKKKEGLELYNKVKEDLKKYKDDCSNCG